MNKLFLALSIFLFSVISENASAQKNESVKVLSYNLNACRPMVKIPIPVFKAISDVIKESKADLIALQEVDVNTKRSGATVNQVEELAKLTGMHYFFAKAINLQDGEYGVAILSKYPIKETFRIELPNPGRELRVVAGVKVELPNKKEIIFLSTNIDTQHANAIKQAEGLIEVASGTKLPLILAGDFNYTPGSAVINVLDQNFQRTCPTEKCPGTYPANAPVKTISHIMYRTNTQFKTVSHRVIDEGKDYASDQRPVFAELELLK
jgi:endonuclease/exonuclease/phosphatase family metal-dependent hydrolase